jgi:hypothetical protein
MFQTLYVGMTRRSGSENDIWIDNVQVAFIPEPSTLVLVGGGLLGMFLLRRRR